MSKRIEAKDSRVIKTQPATDGYRDGWERVFGKKKRIPCCERDHDCDGNCDRHPDSDTVRAILESGYIIPRSVLHKK